MEKLVLLEKKIKQLASEYNKLAFEYKKLLSEKKFLEEENNRAKKVIYENQALNRDKTIIKEKVNFMLNKINELKI